MQPRVTAVTAPIFCTLRALHPFTESQSWGSGSATADGRSTTAEVYDPQTGISTPTATMTAPRDGHTATLFQTVVIIGGGPTTVEVFQ